MRKPWFKIKPHILQRTKDDLRREYPDLRIIIEEETAFIRGSFPIWNNGQFLDRFPLDRFQIEMRFPEDFPNRPPTVRETSGRIPRTLDRHVIPTTGDCCIQVPDEWFLLEDPESILNFLNGPVRNYFLGQSLVEAGEPWPFGERSHGVEGMYESYADILGVSDPGEIRRYLTYLSNSTIKGHWDCPCGSGKRLRNCHLASLRSLQSKVSPRFAQSALNRLDACETLARYQAALNSSSEPAKPSRV
jgi:hypothetical protein